MTKISVLTPPVSEAPPHGKLRYPNRLDSIDVFRAITMLLMIFVNDLWTLEGIPAWLGHKEAGEDGLGLADTVFPAFLVIVGLSIPYAIKNRLKKGDSKQTLAYHVVLRSVSLIIMGVFHVNLETYSAVAVLPKPIWQICITVGFFLIWMDYPERIKGYKTYLLQGIGALILSVMAYLYEGGTPEHPVWMELQWYGILGLIGWSYLICSLIFLVSRGKASIQLAAMFFFILFNSLSHLGWLEGLAAIKRYFWIVGDGAMPAFTMAGVVVSVYYQKLILAQQYNKFQLLLVLFSLAMLVFGVATRPVWGIHKIGDSPSWTTICIGISVIVFGMLIWLVDVKKKKDWFAIIRPAGTSTLTCYLLPYVHYALFALVGVSLPIYLRTGTIGIIKSLLYAVLIILITGLLEKKKIRLKV